ncbi:hypothetical protein [Methylobacterium sp. 22177]|uniref:hypothetical protein n=1 Tax=Methylobacterium sp. 22177 TaxID=3453885 RepID=UPI003F867166
MADLSDLRQLRPAREPAEIDGGLHEPFPEPQRFTSFLPRQRGVLAPAVGPLSDATVVHGLAVSGAGWLNRDGRILANGSGAALDAMRQLPEAAAVFAAWDEAVAECEAAYRTQYAEELAAHEARGGTKASFRFDDGHFSTFDPEGEARAAIGRLGWIALDLRRNRGVREVACEPPRDGLPRFEGHLAALARALDCRVVSSIHAPEPIVLIDATGRRVATPATPLAGPRKEDPALPLLNQIPGFRSYDPATGAIEIEGWGRTVLLPGVRPDEAEPAPSPGP